MQFGLVYIVSWLVHSSGNGGGLAFKKGEVIQELHPPRAQIKNKIKQFNFANV